MAEKKKRRPIDPKLIAEMRKLRGLNLGFDEIAVELNKKGFTNSQGGPLANSNIVYLFKKSSGMDLSDLNSAGPTKADLISVVLRGPLQDSVKVDLIEKIQKGEVTDLNYKKIYVLEGGGRRLEKGNLANPGAKVELNIPGTQFKERCRLIVHFYDEIKAIANLQGV